MHSIIVEPRPAIDQKWFDKLEKISAEASEIYYALEPNPAYVASARKQFFAQQKTTNPVLKPELTNRQLYVQRNQELEALATEIKTNEPNDFIKTAYLARIDELQLQIAILLAAADGDREAFESANMAVYGQPNHDIFAASCAWLRMIAEQQHDHPEQAIRRTAAVVLETVPNVGGTPELLTPSAETFAAVRALHNAPGGYMSQLLAGTEIGEITTETNGDQNLERVLANIGCDYGVAETSNANWGVSHVRRTVIHPHHYSAGSEVFKGVLVHEVGSHLLERMNGVRQPLRLLASGLDRYEASNEGRAYLREQIIYNEPTYMLRQDSWKHTITMHLAISLACGLHGHRFSFSELYAVLEPINLLWERLRGVPDETAKQAAQTETWKTLTRVLKGTDGTGGAYRKDIVYLEGNVRCWQLAKTQPEMILYGDFGKFDITRADHVALLQELRILPSQI